MKLFPQIPSCLELEVLNYVNYCTVCNIHDNKTHPIKYCIHCDRNLCEILGGLWYLNRDPNNFICRNCRSTVTGTFTSTQKYKISNIRKRFNSI